MTEDIKRYTPVIRPGFGSGSVDTAGMCEDAAGRWVNVKAVAELSEEISELYMALLSEQLEADSLHEENDIMRGALESFALMFSSGNDVPVERVMLTRDSPAVVAIFDALEAVSGSDNDS